MLLADRRLLVTGVLTERSIAYAVAERAQHEGAEVVLTGFGRALRLTQRIAKRLPAEPDVLELDVNDPAQLTGLAAELDRRWGRVDGVLHAVAYVPPDALGGRFLETPAASALAAIETSAVSLQALAAALAPLLERSPHGGAIVGLDFDAAAAYLDGTGDPRRELRLGLSRTVATVNENAHVLLLAAKLSGEHEDRMPPEWVPYISRFVTGAARRIARDQQRGIAPTDIPPRLSAQALLAMVENHIVREVVLGRGDVNESMRVLA
jgi:hypothetical protein